MNIEDPELVFEGVHQSGGTKIIFDLFTEEEFNSEVSQGYVNIRPDPDGLMWIANYSQKTVVESHWNEVTENCRGLIFDTNHNIVARSWRKFFNWNQPEAGQLDMSAPVEVTDKVDGSLAVAHRAKDGKYSIATRGSFLSDQALHGTEVLRSKYQHVNFPDGYTFLFEIVYPENRIVLKYDMDDLVLLGAVKIETGEYHGPLEAKDMLQWPGPVTEVFQYQTLKEALEAPPRPNAEGLCIRYINTPKIVKVKQRDYIELHKIVTGLSERTVWEVAMREDGDVSMLLSKIPDELHQWVKDVWRRLNTETLAKAHEAERRFKDIIASLPEGFTRKEFAEVAKEEGEVTPLLFQLLEGREIFFTILKTLKPRGDTYIKTISEEVA